MLSLKISEQVYAAFCTPIFHVEMGETAENMNRDLEAHLLELRDLEKAGDKFDWKTDSDLHTKEEPCLKAITGIFADSIAHLTRVHFQKEISPKDIEIGARIWGAVEKEGSFRPVTENLPFDFRGLYFVRSTGTLIDFVDPRGARPIVGTGEFANQPRKLSLTAKTGSLVIFPGWLNHMVVTPPGKQIQITVEISATVFVNPKGDQDEGHAQG